jgi:hypothetical protein
MTKLCPRGKAAAKRKFAVYPSAYANAYASKICAGKIKDPSGVKRKDFKGPKPVGKAEGGPIKMGPKPNEKMMTPQQREKRFKKPGFGNVKPGKLKERSLSPRTRIKRKSGPMSIETAIKRNKRKELQKLQRPMGGLRPRKMGGGMMQMPRAMYGKGGGVCKRGMNRQAIGKNS